MLKNHSNVPHEWFAYLALVVPPDVWLDGITWQCADPDKPIALFNKGDDWMHRGKVLGTVPALRQTNLGEYKFAKRPRVR